jgi:glycosyltransferase involved in cell wall biosynthesis
LSSPVQSSDRCAIAAPVDGARRRLLIVTRDRYPLYRVDLIELFGRWLTGRFDIDWVCAKAARGAGEVIAGAPGERFIAGRSGPIAWARLQILQAIRVVRGEVDLVQVRDAACAAALFLAAAQAGRRPFVYWMSYPMVEGYRHRGLHPAPGDARGLRLARLAYAAMAELILYRLVLPRAQHVFVQSERMAADLVARGVLPERLSAVPMGVSLSVYHPQAIAPSQDPGLLGKRVLVYVGALDPEREIGTLIAALGQVVRRGFDGVLAIVGTATQADRQRLRQACTAHEVEDSRIVFTGYLPLAEALAYVRRADVCLAPFPVWPQTYLSATPTKLVEYLAMGRPVVATDHPDQTQVLQESGAGVIVARTPEGFAHAICMFLDDPVSAEEIGARGPAWVAAHRDYAAIGARVASVYARLMTSGFA